MYAHVNNYSLIWEFSIKGPNNVSNIWETAG